MGGRALKSNAKMQDLSKKIPEKRLNELEDILKEHYQVEQLTEDIIDQAANCDFKAADNRIDMEQYKLATEGVDPDQMMDLEAYRARAAVQLGINPDLTNGEDKS